MSFCQSVCKHSYGRNFDLILMKICKVIRGLKSKIEFVWDKNLITPSPILPQFLKKIALRPMETSKQYNSVPVKDNCTLFAPTPLFLGPHYPLVSSDDPVAMATNFGTKLTTAWPTLKIIMFAPTRYFRAMVVSFKFLSYRPRCYGNEFWEKIDYNSASAKDNCTLLLLTPYFQAWCHVNFSAEDPCCHGNQPFLFKEKIGCRLTRAEMQLQGYRARQWDRYLVPQNVFLV